MPRKKLSEFRAKTILNAALGQAYQGWEIDVETTDWQQTITDLPEDQNYVVKVDQAIKGRFKKGLVKLDCPKAEVSTAAQAIAEQGYRYLLIEPFSSHDPSAERYFSAERTRSGVVLSYAEQGGVEIEAHADQITHGLYGDSLFKGLPTEQLEAIMNAFNRTHMSFLEINPLLVEGESVTLLDAAVEIDSEGMFFQGEWSAADFRTLARRTLTQEELAIQELGEQSQASFSFELINPDGAIFVLLSGGGASVVVADEVCNQGFGAQLANYGEYSGNPSLEETRLYARELLKSLLASKAPRKVLLIGGGVANFTDVSLTFKGLVAAMTECADQLREQGVGVYVRRGGPHEAEGLALMREFLATNRLNGAVHGPDVPLTTLVTEAVEVLK